MKAFITKKIDVLFSWLGLVLIFGLWFVISLVQNNFLIPKIGDVLSDVFQLITKWNTIWLILKTLCKLIAVVIIAYLFSFFIAFASYKSQKFRQFASPWIALMRCAPVATIILILILITGTKATPIYITLFVLIPVSYEAIYVSLVNCDKDVTEETRLISNLNIKIILLVHIPMAFNYLMANVLSCVGLGFKVLIMGEVLAQGMDTIGGSIQSARASLDTIRVFSWALIVLVIVLLVEYAINLCKKRISM